MGVTLSLSLSPTAPHRRVLADERKYKCHLCPYAAKCRANLNQHLTIHSVKLVSADAEQIAIATETGDRKNCPYYYRWVLLRPLSPAFPCARPPYCARTALKYPLILVLPSSWQQKG